MYELDAGHQPAGTQEEALNSVNLRLQELFENEGLNLNDLIQQDDLTNNFRIADSEMVGTAGFDEILTQETPYLLYENKNPFFR